VGDTLPMDVRNGITQLVRNEPRRRLVQPLMFEDVFEKIPPFNEFQDDCCVTGSRERRISRGSFTLTDFVRRPKRFNELTDVWVTKVAQNFDLPSEGGGTVVCGCVD
jgi:hypothetical protein